jgi:23S rRNA (cytosine1962-C5)-methyltransferase
MSQLKKIRLKSKEERRFKQGHPWVFSNELQESPKALEVGELVELCDAGGAFLAFGFGNPNSLISFRELSRDQSTKHIQDGKLLASFFVERFDKALKFRTTWFSLSESFRMIYGEADGLSGLIIDRFVGPKQVVYVIQPHASGMDKNVQLIRQALKTVSERIEDHYAHIILRKDAGSREKEGLEKETPEVLKIDGTPAAPEFLEKLSSFAFRVPNEYGAELTLSADLISGQKTGFFFDQLQNIKRLESVILQKLKLHPVKNYKVLDLCAYVGQWGAHLERALATTPTGHLSYIAVDVSGKALSFVKQNVKATHVSVEDVKADVLEPIEKLEGRTFDLVIADPPAFIKNRKSIPEGKQAYVKLFQTAIEKTAPGGIVIACSCSQLLSHEDFLETLGKATRRSKRNVRWLTQGSPSFDHFARLDFQEGHYLKSFIGQVD